MRTGLFLVAGFLLLAASSLLGRLFSSNVPSAPLIAAVVFVGSWLVIATANVARRCQSRLFGSRRASDIRVDLSRSGRHHGGTPMARPVSKREGGPINLSLD